MLYSNFELGKGGPMIALKENVQVDVRKFEEIGYTVQRRQFWQYDVVSSSGETVLEVVLLPETALAMSKKGWKFQLVCCCYCRTGITSCKLLSCNFFRESDDRKNLGNQVRNLLSWVQEALVFFPMPLNQNKKKEVIK